MKIVDQEEAEYEMGIDEIAKLEEELGIRGEEADETKDKNSKRDSISMSLKSINQTSKKGNWDQETRYPRQEKVKKKMRELDNEYVKQIKETDKKSRKREDLYEEMNRYNKIINDIKRTNRDEDLLKMQKENQEIENQLKQLKNKDKSELKLKEEESRMLIEQLNKLFNEKKEKAMEKDEERKKIIEEIKQIKKDQEDHKNTIKKFTEEKDRLTKILVKLDKDVDKLKTYKDFIDKVLMSSNESANNEFEKLREKFENLIARMHEIQNDINEQENQIKIIKKEQQELVRKNDKQAQNKRLLELENEIKEEMEKNKKIEKEIEEIQKKNQKKDSDTHQIRLSINNLYLKSKYKESEDHKKINKVKDKDLDLNVTDTVLCNKLTEINERIIDLIKIYNEFKNFKEEK